MMFVSVFSFFFFFFSCVMGLNSCRDEITAVINGFAAN